MKNSQPRKLQAEAALRRVIVLVAVVWGARERELAEKPLVSVANPARSESLQIIHFAQRLAREIFSR